LKHKEGEEGALEDEGAERGDEEKNED